jgi:hypothetical protein
MRGARGALAAIVAAAFAAGRVQSGDAEIGYVNYACSGATIAKGLLGPYPGIEPRPFQRAEAQIEKLAEAAARAEESGGLAAVMISVGANDVGFSKAVKFCALVKRCWDKHFNAALPYAAAGPGFPMLEEYVNERLNALPDGYDELADALDPFVPRRG